MGYDRNDSLPFNFEPNGISFGSKWKRTVHTEKSLLNLDNPKIKVKLISKFGLNKPDSG